jgi:hypothetical protein
MKILFIYWTIAWVILLIDWMIHWREREIDIMSPILQDQSDMVRNIWVRWGKIIFPMYLGIVAGIFLPIKIKEWIQDVIK